MRQAAGKRCGERWPGDDYFDCTGRPTRTRRPTRGSSTDRSRRRALRPRRVRQARCHAQVSRRSLTGRRCPPRRGHRPGGDTPRLAARSAPGPGRRGHPRLARHRRPEPRDRQPSGPPGPPVRKWAPRRRGARLTRPRGPRGRPPRRPRGAARPQRTAPPDPAAHALPRPVGRRDRPGPGHSRRHSEIPHPRRAACPRSRPAQTRISVCGPDNCRAPEPVSRRPHAPTASGRNARGVRSAVPLRHCPPRRLRPAAGRPRPEPVAR